MDIQLGEYEVLEDMMIDGLKIVQDTRLYRFTSDSVLLSRFAKAKKKDRVADFCAGSGIVAFHFYALNKAHPHFTRVYNLLSLPPFQCFLLLHWNSPLLLLRRC